LNGVQRQHRHRDAAQRIGCPCPARPRARGPARSAATPAVERGVVAGAAVLHADVAKRVAIAQAQLRQVAEQPGGPVQVANQRPFGDFDDVDDGRPGWPFADRCAERRACARRCTRRPARPIRRGSACCPGAGLATSGYCASSGLGDGFCTRTGRPRAGPAGSCRLGCRRPARHWSAARRRSRPCWPLYSSAALAATPPP
jgi:hypothetical protein